MTRGQFEALRSPEGSLLIGSPNDVIDKMLYEHELFKYDRFLLHLSVGTMPHDKVMRAIELLGTKVAPAVRRALAGSATTDAAGPVAALSQPTTSAANTVVATYSTSRGNHYLSSFAEAFNACSGGIADNLSRAHRLELITYLKASDVLSRWAAARLVLAVATLGAGSALALGARPR